MGDASQKNFKTKNHAKYPGLLGPFCYHTLFLFFIFLLSQVESKQLLGLLISIGLGTWDWRWTGGGPETGPGAGPGAGAGTGPGAGPGTWTWTWTCEADLEDMGRGLTGTRKFCWWRSCRLRRVSTRTSFLQDLYSLVQTDLGGIGSGTWCWGIDRGCEAAAFVGFVFLLIL